VLVLNLKAAKEIGHRSALLQLLTSGIGRYCCKSLFALMIKISFGCTRDFRVKMGGTSSPDDKLADDLGSAVEGIRISGRRLDFFRAGKLAPGNFGLLQQYLPLTVIGASQTRVGHSTLAGDEGCEG
jgi:hypothetical protein